MAELEPWPAPDEPKRAPLLCAECGASIVWRRPIRQQRGGWKHESTGFTFCDPSMTRSATPPRED